MLFEAQLKAKEALYKKDWGEAPLDFNKLLDIITSDSSPSGDEAFFAFLQAEISRINK